MGLLKLGSAALVGASLTYLAVVGPADIQSSVSHATAPVVSTIAGTAGQIGSSSPAAPDALRQARFACAQITLQANDLATTQQLAQALAQARGLSGAAADKFDDVRIKNRHASHAHTDCAEIIPRFSISRSRRHPERNSAGGLRKVGTGSQSG